MDISIFNFIFGLSHRFWVFDYLAVFIAQYLGYLLIILALFFIFLIKKWQEKIYYFSLFALSLILSRGVITEIIKFSIKRQRPFAALDIQSLIKDSGYAFPSGHATLFFALALSVFYMNRKWGFRFFAGAALISLARVYVGVHWPSDILVGALIGLVCAFCVEKALKKYRPLVKKTDAIIDDEQIV